MITVTVQYDQARISLSFPCADSEMEKRLEQLEGRGKSDLNLFIAEVNEPKELSVLQGRFVNLDELNYLAKRMESMDHQERMQYYAAAAHCGMHDMKDLINLTFNLSCYTLIRDFSSMEAIGRTHLLNLLGGLEDDLFETNDFAAEGKKLIASGRGAITEFGILFRNEEITFDELYDGQVFPQYIYEECLAIAELTYQEKTEYIYLPCEALSISKALHRLNAGNLQECSINLFAYTLDKEEWLVRMRNILRSEGLYATNRLANAINGFTEQEEWEKLAAVAEYADAQDSKSLIQLAAKMDCFMFVPDIDNQEELARYWIEHREEYELSPELEDFFLYEQFGEQIEIYTEGSFLPSGGFVYIDNGQSLDEIMERNTEDGQEQKHMTMGGM